ncbi:MAG TPA: hypothetical protein VNP73_02665, partial [Actinomycetota bacterium]|nr:hypothetical protein [Actinomycetota bacterium]
MRKLVVAVACLVFVVLPLTAGAVGSDDPNDTTGRLDVGYLGTYVQGSERVFEITMYEQWRNRLFRFRKEHAQRGSIVFLFNTDADKAPELSVTPERRDGRWVGRLCRVQTGRCERARVWRESD